MKYWTASFHNPKGAAELIIKDIAATELETAKSLARARAADELGVDHDYTMGKIMVMKQDYAVCLSTTAFPLKIVIKVEAEDTGLAIAKARVLLNSFFSTDPTAGVLDDQEAYAGGHCHVSF